MSEQITCPHCGTQFQIEITTLELLQPELPGLIVEVKNNLDTQEPKTHAERPATRFDSVRESSFLPLTERDSNRIESSIASGEEALIESVRKIVGDREW